MRVNSYFLLHTEHCALYILILFRFLYQVIKLLFAAAVLWNDNRVIVEHLAKLYFGERIEAV